MSDVESFVQRHLPQKTPGFTLTHLERGISNVNYKVTFTGQESGQARQMVMTIFFNPRAWWKIDKELFLREMACHDPDILLPKIIDTGEDCLGEHRVAFLLREFIEGYDLDRLLEEGSSQGFDDGDWSVIARDAGFRLGALHTLAFSFFGRVTGAESQFAQRFSWKEFYLQELEAMLRGLKSCPRTKQIGSRPVEHIVSLLPAIEEFVEAHVGSLDTVKDARLVHGDARFANFVAGCDEDGSWRIKALIDLERAMSGDPEADLSGIENWLYCSRYQAHFYQVRRDFMAGYNVRQSVSPQYREKRLLYHTIRCLGFLCGAFALDDQKLSRATADLAWSVEQNYQILRSLASGDYLENLGILPINES